ncbi:MAG: hypothetical protein QOI80_932 [Solirubrobacteraceae bacterium]|nr:hypothetical protein [Solirubrobacteraceae bacterium]
MSAAALAGRVDAALADLDEPERIALEARERDGDDYARIAERLGLRREGVADLLVSARLAVRAHVREAPEPPRRTAQCGPARRVMAAEQDGEAVGPRDLDRVREHLATCEPCQAARLALREAALACRAWRTLPPGAAPPPPPVPATARARTRPRPAAVSVGRRRAAAAIAALVIVIVLLAVVLGGSGGGNGGAPAAPPTQQGSADAPGRDVVPPPGDKFCPAGELDCK